MNFKKIFCYDRIGVTEGNDINKTSASKQCNQCNYYWYFLNKRFKIQPYIYNRCHDLLMMSMNLTDNAILKIKSVDYRCIVTGIIKLLNTLLFTYIMIIESSHYIKYFLKRAHV